MSPIPHGRGAFRLDRRRNRTVVYVPQKTRLSENVILLLDAARLHERVATAADGKQIEHWNGVDVNLNARLVQGLTLQGGVSTGRTSTDNCGVVLQHPELITTATTAMPLSYCHVDAPFSRRSRSSAPTRFRS